jgi:hypothetical protein
MARNLIGNGYIIEIDPPNILRISWDFSNDDNERNDDILDDTRIKLEENTQSPPQILCNAKNMKGGRGATSPVASKTRKSGLFGENFASTQSFLDSSKGFVPRIPRLKPGFPSNFQAPTSFARINNQKSLTLPGVKGAHDIIQNVDGKMGEHHDDVVSRKSKTINHALSNYMGSPTTSFHRSIKEFKPSGRLSLRL